MIRVKSWNLQASRLARSYALSCVFWLPISQLVGWQTYVMDRREHVPALMGPLLLAYCARYLSIAVLTPPMFMIVERWPLTTATLRRSIAYALGFVLFTCVFAVIRWLLLPPWLEETLTFGPRSLATLVDLAYTTPADILLAYAGIVAVAHAYTYFVRGQRQEIERLALQRCLAQSELQALRTQLHPHFLFNTLHGITALIESDPSRAHAMLTSLAVMLRSALNHGSADLVPFREELRFVEAYIGLEQMRLGSRLRVQWRIEPRSLELLVPQLLLQPLVENGIRYGAASDPDGGSLRLETSIKGNRLSITIVNSIAACSKSGHGVGLANTRARLQYLYADDAHLQLQLDQDDKRAVACVTLPLLRERAAQEEPDAAQVQEVS
jgi:two-component system, LytTR family, sensor kinase